MTTETSDKVKEGLASALGAIVGNIDYTQGACSLTASVAAALPIELLYKAHNALAAYYTEQRT